MICTNAAVIISCCRHSICVVILAIFMTICVIAIVIVTVIVSVIFVQCSFINILCIFVLILLMAFSPFAGIGWSSGRWYGSSTTRNA